MSGKAAACVASVLVLLAFSGCYDAQDATNRCADHGGLRQENTRDTGLFNEDTDATVFCKDGTVITYEGWNVNEQKPPR